MKRKLIIARVNIILATLIKPGSLIIYCLMLTLLLNCCLSSKKVTAMVKAYDNCIYEKQSINSKLPAGISLNLQNPLPDSSSIRKSYVMVLPLVVINYFQTNHKLTLGQSSLETPTVELFKSELLRNFELLDWDVPYQHGYAINIDVVEIEASGVFSSGGYFFIAPGYGTGTGASGDISQCTRIQSKVHISFNLNNKDSLIAHTDVFLFVEANGSGKVKLGYRENQTRKYVLIPASLPKLVLGKSFEYLIPATKAAYYIAIKSVSREIVIRVRNNLSDFYSATR